MPLEFELKSAGRKGKETQITNLILDGVKRTAYSSRRAVISPMKSTANTIGKILKSHLNVQTGKSSSAGFASGLLSQSLKVNPLESYIEEMGYKTVGFPGGDFAIVLPFELDMQYYGYPIGEEGGYAFSANYQQIAKWIASRNYNGFYYLSGGKKRQVVDEKGAERAAYMIMKKLTGTRNEVLPNWYKVKKSDINRLLPRIRSSTNLLTKKMKVEFEKIFK